MIVLVQLMAGIEGREKQQQKEKQTTSKQQRETVNVRVSLMKH